MQEFVLYSRIPATRHSQVLQILAGVTASQPARISEQNLVFEQLKPAVPLKKGQTQQPQRLSHHQLVRTAGQDVAWTLRAAEVPEPGEKRVISRSVSQKLLAQEDLERFRSPSEWYKLTNQLNILGNRFVHGDVVIRVTRIYVPASSPSDDPLHATTIPAEDMKPLDPSGAYAVEACIRAEDGAGSTIRDKAISELQDFAKMLKGAIDLHVPDRLSLDPRLKAA